MSCKSCWRKITWSKRQQLKVIRKVLKRTPKTATTLPKIKGLCPDCAKVIMQRDLSALLGRSKNVPSTVKEMAEGAVRGEVPKTDKVKKEIKKLRENESNHQENHVSSTKNVEE